MGVFFPTRYTILNTNRRRFFIHRPGPLITFFVVIILIFTRLLVAVSLLLSLSPSPSISCFGFLFLQPLCVHLILPSTYLRVRHDRHLVAPFRQLRRPPNDEGKRNGQKQDAKQDDTRVRTNRRSLNGR